MVIGLLYLFVILVFVGYVARLIVRRPKYTHERFAFTFMSSLIIFAAASIIPIFAGESLLVIFVKGLSGLFGYEPPSSSNFYDKVLSIILLAILGYVGVRLHSQMVGLTTDRKFQARRRGKTTGIISDALAECKAKTTRSPLPLATEEEKSSINIHVDINRCMDWKSRAHRLLIAYSNQFQIDPQIDWIDEVQAYFCTYGKKHVGAIVYCPTSTPNGSDFARLAAECEAQSFDPKKFIIFTESGIGNLGDVDLKGLPKPEIHNEEGLLEQIADFETYRRHIIHTYEKELLSASSGLTLKDTYTALTASNEDSEIPDLEKHVQDWSEELGSRHLAILGEYGHGKSTFATKIAYTHFRHGVGRRIPVIIELRGRNPRSEEIEQLVFPWCKRFGVSPDALLALHAAGKILLILDGFDEMDHVGDAEIRLSHMKRLWQLSGFQKAKILLTGRPNFFFDTSERERALLIRDELEDRPYCEPIRLLPLSREQAEVAIREFPTEVVNGILNALSSKAASASLKELLLRPSTLIWAATVWETLNVEETDAPILSASVLRRFIKQANDRQTLKGLNTVLLASERQYLTTAVALEIHDRASGTNQISSDQLQSFVELCIDAMPDVLAEFLEAGEDGKISIGERFQDKQRLVDSVVTEIRTSGILVEDVSKPNTLRFAHKSFYEYLVGEALAVSRSKALLRETRQYDAKENLKHTSYGSIEAAIEGLRNVDLVRPNVMIFNGREVDQFAGETMVNMCVEIMRLSDATMRFEAQARYEIVQITRMVWLGHRSNLLIAAFSVGENTEEISVPEGILPYSLRTLLIDIPQLSSRRYAIRIWVFGARGLGFKMRKLNSSTPFRLIRDIVDMSSPDAR